MLGLLTAFCKLRVTQMTTYASKFPCKVVMQQSETNTKMESEEELSEIKYFLPEDSYKELRIKLNKETQDR